MRLSTRSSIFSQNVNATLASGATAAAVPYMRGDTNWNLTGLYPKRDCGLPLKGLNYVPGTIVPGTIVSGTMVSCTIVPSTIISQNVQPLLLGLLQSRLGAETSWNLTGLYPKRDCGLPLNPFRTAVPVWGQSSQISSSLSPKWDCGPKRVKRVQPRTRYDRIRYE